MFCQFIFLALHPPGSNIFNAEIFCSRGFNAKSRNRLRGKSLLERIEIYIELAGKIENCEFYCQKLISYYRTSRDHFSTFSLSFCHSFHYFRIQLYSEKCTGRYFKMRDDDLSSKQGSLCTLKKYAFREVWLRLLSVVCFGKYFYIII